MPGTWVGVTTRTMQYADMPAKPSRIIDVLLMLNPEIRIFQLGSLPEMSARLPNHKDALLERTAKIALTTT